MLPVPKVNILLIDDQPKNLLALETILESLGQNLVRATSGEEALRCLLHQEFAVIILDMQMAGMDSFEVAVLLRERLTSQDTPILFITTCDRPLLGSTLKPDEKRSQALRDNTFGTVDYVLQPIVPELLLSKVSTFISLFQKTRQIEQLTVQLETANQELQCQRLKYNQTQASWQQVKEELESLVAQRTEALRTANHELVAATAKHRQVEIALRKSEFLYRTLVETVPLGIEEIDTNGMITFSNSAHHKMLGYAQGELIGKSIWDICPESERLTLPGYIAMLVQEQPPPTPYQGKSLTKDGHVIDVQVDWNYKRDEQGRVIGFISVIADISNIYEDLHLRQQAELALQELNRELEQRVHQRTVQLEKANEQLQAEVTERCQVEEALRQRVERERLITKSIQRIRETLALDVILSTTVEEVRQFLQVDRVLVYRIWLDGTGSPIAEAVVSNCSSILGHTFPEEVFPQEFHQLYCQGRVRAVVDAETDEMTPCLVDFLRQWGVKSKLVVPIVYQGKLWGLLIAHHCSQIRQWQPLEMDLLQQLAIQLAIAIQQADLYQQVQLELAERKEAENALRQARDELEIKVIERTAELRTINASLENEIRAREAAAKQRRAAEEALRTSEERFRVALKNSPITTFNQDAELRYTWLYAPSDGYYVEHIVGKSDDELFEAEDAQKLTAIKRRVLTTGVGTREEACISFKGQARCYDLTVEPLLGSNGEITGITCAVMDITEIRDREKQLRAIFEGVIEAILILDEEGTCVEANSAASHLFGLPLSQLLGKQITDVLEPGWDFDSEWHTFLASGQKTGEVRLLRPDGTVRDAEYTAKASFLPSRHLVVLRDITERKQAEEIRHALEAEKKLRRFQLRFFSMVSHEFRTPLSTILGSAQLLKSSTQAWTEEKKLRNLSRIERAAKNMTQLLDDLLTINRAESGKLEFNPHPIELERFCCRLVEDFQLNASSKHHITFTLQSECPKVSLDEKLLRSILTNLLSNAIKYSPQGGRIHLSLTCNTEEVVFQIQDQGIGIPLENQAHVFELFHRGKNVEKIPGTGLGLSVVKKCIDLQEGRISISSKVGVGTTIIVTIPLASTSCLLS